MIVWWSCCLGKCGILHLLKGTRGEWGGRVDMHGCIDFGAWCCMGEAWGECGL
jgi:hypothetical protein